ncbi:MAG TPA: hypothetical protein VIF14_17295 [Alphaproteobacteria bacterium]|jgi:hypothetical protein
MTGIYIAAIVASALALAVMGGFLVKGASPGERRFYGGLLLLQLPMSWLAFEYVRVPLDSWIRSLIADRETYSIVTLFYAPFTEEPAKLWPLLLPWVWRRLNRANAVRVALALGLGFGIGEIAFLAARLASVPAMAALPWYGFGGFVAERLMVCLWHAAFTAVTVTAAALSAKRIPIGFLGSAALHFIGNFPIFLASLRLFGLGVPEWQLLLLGWTVVYAVAMALLLVFLARATGSNILAPRKRACRRCGAEYRPPTLALNLGAWRYERCPFCGKAQWT